MNIKRISLLLLFLVVGQQIRAVTMSQLRGFDLLVRVLLHRGLGGSTSLLEGKYKKLDKFLHLLKDAQNNAAYSILLEKPIKDFLGEDYYLRSADQLTDDNRDTYMNDESTNAFNYSKFVLKNHLLNSASYLGIEYWSQQVGSKYAQKILPASYLNSEMNQWVVAPILRTTANLKIQHLINEFDYTKGILPQAQKILNPSLTLWAGISTLNHFAGKAIKHTSKEAATILTHVNRAAFAVGPMRYVWNSSVGLSDYTSKFRFGNNLSTSLLMGIVGGSISIAAQKGYVPSSIVNAYNSVRGNNSKKSGVQYVRKAVVNHLPYFAINFALNKYGW